LKLTSRLDAKTVAALRLGGKNDETFWDGECPPSALVRQIGWVEEGRISGSS
jgi:hypothetical protein